MAANNAFHPIILLRNVPIGTPKTKELLNPIKMIPIAVPLFSRSTRRVATAIATTIAVPPLIPCKTLVIITISNEWLTLVMILLKIKIISIHDSIFFRSILMVSAMTIGAPIAAESAKDVTNNPAADVVTCKSSATIWIMPVMIYSIVPIKKAANASK